MIGLSGKIRTGTASGTTIDSGGTQFLGVSGGTGTATDTTINGGAQIVSGNGIATSTTIESGGVPYVGFDDGIGTATDTTISAGGSQIIAASGGVGTAIQTYISGGEQVVCAGGTAVYDFLYSGGVADILSGGIVIAPEIDGGTLQLAAGASVRILGIDVALEEKRQVG